MLECGNVSPSQNSRLPQDIGDPALRSGVPLHYDPVSLCLTLSESIPRVCEGF